MDPARQEFAKHIARREFADLLIKNYPTENWFQPGHEFLSQDPFGSNAYAVGLRPNYLPLIKDKPEMQFIENEITTHTASFNRANVPANPHLRLPTNGGWVIGWELIAECQDSYEGKAIVRQADRDAIDIEVTPAALTSADWTLRVYTLDPAAYLVD